ncbi:MAG TPA: hypothetical protein VMX15_00020 [Candidatus Heimdallarchaeota archaeon]|nr:hypothetical protein [Candidatus Heimdallarchaeota archaeon]
MTAPIGPPETMMPEPESPMEDMGEGMIEEFPIDALDVLRLDTADALSDEREEDHTTDVPMEEEPTLEEDLGADTDDEETKDGLALLYGSDFPLLMDEEPEDDDWASWVQNLWETHRAGVENKLWLAQRNRLYRRGIQWITAKSGGPWREPPKPKDTARVVDNMIAPALDQRIQLLAENRPGFKTRPTTRDPDDLKKAEAQQAGLEYQFDQQNMTQVMREAAYWAQTDGVSFVELFWDPDRGPWHEFPTEDGGQAKMPLGELAPRVRKIEQVRVSADASATQEPWYWIVKEVIPIKQAIREHGPEVTDDIDRETDMTDMRVSEGLTRLGHIYPDDDALLRDQDLVERITMYCKRSEYLKNGMTLTIVGKKVVFHGPLLWDICPMIRWTDGSTDPAFFPMPIMDGWLDSQMRVNATLSKLVENVRLNSGMRLLGKTNAIAGETLVGGTTSMIEVKGLGNLNEIVRPMEAFSIGQDALKLLEREKLAFENLSGWNDVSRGQFSGDTSGRAILAIREQLERIFAPPIGAATIAMVQWGKISIKGMRWGYDVPRTLGMMGQGRPDLARILTSEDFDGEVDVWIDPETLMPMPRALRLFLLDNMFQQGIITPQEYRRRQPFAWVGSIGTPDDDHEARAHRTVEALLQGAWPEILWQDNEAVHQDVLERELILPDTTDPMVKQLAQQRWLMLAEQAAIKAGVMPMPAGGMQNGPPGGSPAGPGPSGEASPQPMQGTNPGMAAPPQAGGVTDQERTTKQFENKFQPQ